MNRTMHRTQRESTDKGRYRFLQNSADDVVNSSKRFLYLDIGEVCEYFDFHRKYKYQIALTYKCLWKLCFCLDFEIILFLLVICAHS